jgi:hypothetical protein
LFPEEPSGNTGGTAALGWSAPDGLGDWNDLVITTDGTYAFGATGPSIVVYDDFSGGTPGAAVGLSAPLIGAWSQQGTSPLIYTTGGKDGGTCASLLNTTYAGTGNTARVRQNIVDFANSTEVYVFFNMRWPGGVTGSGTPGVWPATSHLKHIWFGSNRAVGADGETDFVAYTHVPGAAIGGNDGQLSYISSAADGKTNHDFDGWNTYQTWVKAGSSPVVDNTLCVAMFVSADVIAESSREDKKLFVGSGHVNCAFVCGWFGNSDSAESGFDPKMDDVYISAGDAAPARVMIGNAATWAACRQIWIAPPTAWGNASITCKLPRTGASLSGKYLYVFNASNTLLSSVGVLL